MAEAAAGRVKATRPFSPFEWTLALRYIRPRRFISVIAGFSLLGISVAVATLVVVMAVMNGFRVELLDKILGINGHIIVQPIESDLTDYDEVAKRISEVPGVHAAMPIIEGQALASGPSTGSSGVLVRGIRGPDLIGMQKISGSVEDSGALLDFDNSGGVAIGTGLASSLGINVGDKVTLISPRGAITPLGSSPRVKSYPVVAIFSIGMSEYDSTYVFMPLSEAQLYFNNPDAAQAIEVYLDNPDEVGRLRATVEEAAKRPVFTTDWRMRNVTFFSALQVERNVMFLILALIVLVAALNIISGLIMLVKDKGRDIAILRTMGATSGRGAPRVLHHRRFDRNGRNADRARHRHDHLHQHRVAAPVRELGDRDRSVRAGALFPLHASCRNGPSRDDRDRHHGARAILSCDALPRLAGGEARSRRGAALRMSEAPIREAEAESAAPTGAFKGAARKSALMLDNIVRSLSDGFRAAAGSEGGKPLRVGRGNGCTRGTVRSRKIDAPPHCRPARVAGFRGRLHRRRNGVEAWRRRAHRLAAPPDRLRLPIPSSPA